MAIFTHTLQRMTKKQTANDIETYTFEDTYFEPQEKTAFTALEFKQSNNQIMNPNNSFILNSK